MRGYAEWNFVFSYRWDDGGYAVVSTARMTNSDEVTLSRLRKMVTKSVGVMYYGLSVSDDPASVLYTPLSVDDLDRMGENLPGVPAGTDPS
jgi:predicted Zn-dependent protease